MAEYLNNKEFEKTLKSYKENPEEHETELFSMFELLITKILEGFNFSVDKDDAKQECFLLIIRRLKQFDVDRGSAFNFFTTIIINHLRHLYSKDKKYSEKIESFILLHKYSNQTFKTL